MADPLCSTCASLGVGSGCPDCGKRGPEERLAALERHVYGALPLWPEHVRCGTCRWWTPPGPAARWPPRRAHGNCDVVTWDGYHGDEAPIGLAFTVDGSCDGYGIETRDDFGCRLWEPRE